MTMLLNPQHALFNLSVNPTSSYAVSSPLDQNQNFQPPGIPVSSSLALSSSLLQAAGPLKALSYAQRARARVSNVTSPASSETCKDKDKAEEEMPTLAPESDRSTSPSERQEDSEDTSLNLEKIERRAKASIEKLRHILLRVKTRSPEGSNAPSESSQRTCEDGTSISITALFLIIKLCILASNFNANQFADERFILMFILPSLIAC
jgi:small-conductance mechanosensitive channel